MPHNGGRLQTTPWFLQAGGAFPFIDCVKHLASWGYADNSGRPPPTEFDANGYPASGGTATKGVKQSTFVPPQSSRDGQYVCDWVGDLGSGAITGTGITVVSGTNGGANGRFVCSLSGLASSTGQIQNFGISAGFNTSNPITRLRFFHVDDESLINSGELVNPTFVQLIQQGGVGVIRDLDLKNNNTTCLALWENRHPADHYSYSADYAKASIYAGTTGGTADAFTATLSGVSSLTHGLQIIVLFHANGTVTGGNIACTLNLNSLGDVPIANSVGGFDDFGTLHPVASRYGVLTYDSQLGYWIKVGGDTAVGNSFITASVPYETFLQLCDACGAHPWFVQPYLSGDLTNLMGSLATYTRSYSQANASWMVPRFELPSNENWNPQFTGTNYSSNKALNRWGTASVNNYHGRAFALNAQQIWNAYGLTSKNKDVLHLVCGFQVAAGIGGTTVARLESTLHQGDSDFVHPASYYATHVAPASYWSSAYITSDTELQIAYDYGIGDASTKAAKVAAYVNADSASGIFGLTAVIAEMQTFKTFGVGYGCDLTSYEGGASFGYPSANDTASISGITNANPGVITLTAGAKAPPVGITISVSGTSGSTGINGQSMTVVAYDSVNRKITTDRDTTGDGTWTSGGTVTFVNSSTLRHDLRQAAKHAPDLRSLELNMLNQCNALGMEWMAEYVFSGDNGWGIFDPDIYSTPSTRWLGMIDFNASFDVTEVAVPQIVNQPAGASLRRRARYESYDSIVRREKIQEIEALKTAILARGEVAPRLAEKAQEFVPYRDTMSITTLVAELARVQRELEDEDEVMKVFAFLH